MLSLEVSDNGRGLARSDLAKSRSFGLRGLHERASTMGGWVDVSSNADGTVLMLSIPVRQSSDGAAGAAGAPQAFDQDEDHNPSAWGTL